MRHKNLFGCLVNISAIKAIKKTIYRIFCTFLHFFQTDCDQRHAFSGIREPVT